ncbi:hypothetical protein [Sphingomonas sp. MS122]|uniref:hypothetical protein n=1 Tax=Sphingomonas sp. MS122 TaxID=3412683 RepID=UPI003C2B983D
MKALMLGIAAAAAMLPGTAFAQAASDTSTGQVVVNGNVARLCILGTPSRATVDLGQMAATSGTRVGRIAALGEQSVTLPGSFCNFAGSALTVTVTALVSTDASAVQPGFAKAVNYTATASNWAITSTAATSAATASGATPTATSTGATQPAPKTADVNVTLSGFTAPSDALLTAGTYNGLVVVTLGPAVSGGL